MKCQICNSRHAVMWSWQPFGPGATLTFVTPGSHYRGFAVVKVCDDCKRRLEAGETVEFAHKSHTYRFDGSNVQWLRLEPQGGM